MINKGIRNISPGIKSDRRTVLTIVIKQTSMWLKEDNYAKRSGPKFPHSDFKYLLPVFFKWFGWHNQFITHKFQVVLESLFTFFIPLKK